MKQIHKKGRFNLILLIILFPVFHGTNTCAQYVLLEHSDYKEYYVDKAGFDSNNGSYDAPFLTINMAAQVAMPGDIITVRRGIYREWIKPARGGSSEEARITYQAEESEEVIILGSEKIEGWEDQGKGIWKIELDDSFFGAFNPFKTLTRHPEYVGVDESGDGWGWLKYGRWTHLGDVYINGSGLTERNSLKAVKHNAFTWFVKPGKNKTTIWANFNYYEPNFEIVELNVRERAFFPETPGLNYITVRGFTIKNVACHWAPPTVHQPAAVGPNGGHHWIIEDNLLMYAKACAISIGIPSADLEAEIKGHHIIRNNVIMRCGQAGTIGQHWCNNSRIYGNHIEDINYRKEFGGWETAGIKHHNTDSLIVQGNFIRGVYTIDPIIGAAHGIWNDYSNSNWNVAHNIIMNTDGHAILVEANRDGPNLFANNILINGSIGTYSSRGDAWVHNLFVNCEQKWENQTWGNRPQIGDARWMNNIFFGGGLASDILEDNSIYKGNVFQDNASTNPLDDAVFISSIPSEFSIDDFNGLTIKFNIDNKVLQGSYPPINASILDLPFSFDVSIDDDFFSNSRYQRIIPGPFSNLLPGQNEIMIYNYPNLYYDAIWNIDEF